MAERLSVHGSSLGASVACGFTLGRKYDVVIPRARPRGPVGRRDKGWVTELASELSTAAS